MAVLSTRVTVTTAATKMSGTDSGSSDGQSIIIRNRGAASVFLGGPTVTAAAGFELEATQSIEIDLSKGDYAESRVGGETVYAITASGSSVCHVMQAGV